jgi:hypothetical protein
LSKRFLGARGTLAAVNWGRNRVASMGQSPLIMIRTAVGFAMGAKALNYIIIII